MTTKQFNIQMVGSNDTEPWTEYAALYYIVDGVAIFLNENGAVTGSVPAHAVRITEIIQKK